MVRNKKGQFEPLKNIKDLVGKRYGKLVVTEFAFVKKCHTYWKCVCDCGREKIIRGDTLGVVNSCGCIKKKQDRINLTANHSHKMSRKRLYVEWQSMKNRCSCKSNKRYDCYGGRGIRICEEWKSSFEVFQKWALENGYSDKLTLDRIDVNGNYEPSNCRWVSREVQDNNTRRTVRITHNGKTMSMMQWSRELGIPYHKLRYRRRIGYVGEDILNVNK